MGKLSSALPRGQSAESSVQSDSGIYSGLFVGMTDPFEWVSTWGDKCRVCKGAGTGKNGDGQCFLCGGSGKRTEQHVKLRYELENGVTEEEEVQFKLSPPGVGRGGEPLSASKLFLRLRTLSGMRDASPDTLDEWYTGLGSPIRIPIQVVIEDNASGTALKITNVMRGRDGGGASSSRSQDPPQRSQPPRAAAPPAEEAYDFEGYDSEEIPF